MLTLIGLGIWNWNDLSVRALGELKKCDVVFAEEYTSRMADDTIAKLAKKINKKIIVLGREEVESGKQILAEAAKKKVALLTPGDPMIATTHVSLVLEAKKRKIQTQIIHASSIFTSAIGEAGLQIYKFGKTVTLPKWRENYKPTSTYDVVLENKARGLHTLLLLDIDEGKPMELNEALAIMEKMEEEKKLGVFADDAQVVVLSRIGSGEQKVAYAQLIKLKTKKFGRPPYALIIPGSMHFLEKEFVEGLRF